MNDSVTVFWFRRDLRLEDNRGLEKALVQGRPVVPVFIFDSDILKSLSGRDARVEFIHGTLRDLDERLKKFGSALQVYFDTPENAWREILKRFRVEAIHLNEDYEPYALKRDRKIADLASSKGVSFEEHKDQVLFAKSEIAKDDGRPYRMFTPYWRKWRAELKATKGAAAKDVPSEKHAQNFAKLEPRMPSLEQIGFTPSGISVPKLKFDRASLRSYGRVRDRMDLENATSRLGTHLRFGTLSVRRAVREALDLNETWLKELVWREFFMQILHHYPYTVGQPFDARFAKMPWRDDARGFKAWREGRTGYPIVDAGMRELSATGFMHNRARMITASFLTKHLLIDWRLGERHFAEKLLDFELSSNVGNWQWVAGSGCDAAPYFRIFNPSLQAKKFDKAGAYVRRWVPEFGTGKYPEPIVDHEMARRRALTVYSKHIKGG
ncbi:MAG TPA: deoxyribodipyrimidine photo-lyase [Bdellovibrionales bacterium]|nr:deoxyribodipyrimidine photo-lyase [Bdellovibrionales bacterium]